VRALGLPALVKFSRKPPGMRTVQLVLGGPCSISSTRSSARSESRLAIAQPADPAPTIT
jgi:hypothetical protein